MAEHEAQRERKRSDLLKELQEVRDLGEREHAKRRQLEKALRDAASVFKKEMWDKNDEMHALQVELRVLRDQQTKSLEAVMSSLADAAGVGKGSRGAAAPAPLQLTTGPGVVGLADARAQLIGMAAAAAARASPAPSASAARPPTASLGPPHGNVSASGIGMDSMMFAERFAEQLGI